MVCLPVVQKAAGAKIETIIELKQNFKHFPSLAHLLLLTKQVFALIHAGNDFDKSWTAKYAEHINYLINNSSGLISPPGTCSSPKVNANFRSVMVLVLLPKYLVKKNAHGQAAKLNHENITQHAINSMPGAHLNKDSV